MKVFISWSGERSKLIALELKQFIMKVHQLIRPWHSEEDTGRGEQWFTAINDQISQSTTGIVCLTKENKAKPWILFEAGALVKGIAKNRLFTLIIDFNSSDLVGSPLYHFNHTCFDQKGILKMITDFNGYFDEHSRLNASVIEAVFNALWPQFEESIKLIMNETSRAGEHIDPAPAKDKQTVLLENILQAVSQLDKSINNEDRKFEQIKALQIQMEIQRDLELEMRDKVEYEKIRERALRGLVNHSDPGVLTSQVVELIKSKQFPKHRLLDFQDEISSLLESQYKSRPDYHQLTSILRQLSLPKI